MIICSRQMGFYQSLEFVHNLIMCCDSIIHRYYIDMRMRNIHITDAFVINCHWLSRNRNTFVNNLLIPRLNLDICENKRWVYNFRIPVYIYINIEFSLICTCREGLTRDIVSYIYVIQFCINWNGVVFFQKNMIGELIIFTLLFAGSNTQQQFDTTEITGYHFHTYFFQDNSDSEREALFLRYVHFKMSKAWRPQHTKITF